MSSKLAIEEMDALRQLALEITSELDSDKLLNTIINSAMKLLNGTGAGVYGYMPDGDELKAVAVCGTSISLREKTLKVGEGLAGQVLKAYLSGKVPKEQSGMKVDDYDSWEFRSSQISRGLFKAVAADILQAPGGRILGVLYVSNDVEGRTFSDRDMLLLSLLASHAAIAMRNAEMLAEKELSLRRLELSLKQLELTDTFDENIRAAFSLKSLLQITLREALKAVGAVDGSVMILDHERKVLEIGAGMVNGEYRKKKHPEFELGQGIAGWVAVNGESCNCRDTKTDPRYHPSYTNRDIRSILSVPIISGGLVLGVVSADSEKTDDFDEHKTGILKTLASHVAQALESHRFREVAISLSTLSEEAMYKSIVKNACILTGTQVSTIFLKEGNDIKRAAVFALEPMQEEVQHEGVRDDGITRNILNTGKPVIISDAEAHPDVKTSMKTRGVRSLMGVPLSVRVAGDDGPRVENIGVLFVSSKQKRDFGERDREILQSLASQAAVAITKTRFSQFQQSLLSSAFDAIIAVDDAGTVREFNDSAQKILGYTREEIVDRVEVTRFIRPEKADDISNMLADPRNGGRVEDIDTFAINNKGDEIPIRLSVSRLGSGTVGFFRDQRDIVKARRHIVQLEGLLQTVHEITKAELRNMRSVLATTVAKTMEMLQTDIVSLYLYDQEADKHEQGMGKLHLPPERVGVTSGREPDNYAGPEHSARRVIRHGAAVFTSDARQEPLVNGDFVEREGVVACAACPLKLGNKIVGVLFCNYRSPHNFTEEDKAMINLFTSELAIVLENARLFNESEQRAEQLQALNLFSLGLTAGLAPEDILQTLVNAARIYIGAQYAALGILTDERKLDPFVVSGLEREEADKITHPPVGMGVLDSILKEGEEINLPDVTAHAGYVGEFPDNHPQIASFIGVPIVSQHKIIGDLYAANKLGADTFSEEDLTNLRHLATLVAFVMERVDSQEKVSATQTVNISFLLLSKWALTVKQQRAKLEEYMRQIESSLGDGDGAQITQLLGKMSETLKEMDAPRESLEIEYHKHRTQPVNLSRLLHRSATRQDVIDRIKSTPVLDLKQFCVVTGNELLLEFALNILINNSVEAIERKGGAGEIRVECQSTERFVQVHIADTGAGIPEDYRSSLYRVPLPSGAGTGHGSLAAGMILKVHGGDIKIVSTSSKGTTINFWLPVDSQ